MKHLYFTFAIVLMLASLGQVVSDIYLTSLPFISHGLHASIHLVQLSLFAFMAGLSVSQLVYGPLSDAVGRRKPLIIGLILCLAGSVLCATADNIVTFNIGRLIQGLGAGAGMALSRSVMRDLFSGTQMAKVGSYLAIANIAIMAGAPFVGSYIQHWFGWRENFVAIIFYTIVVLAAITGLLPETNQHRHRDHIRLPVIKANVKTLFGSKVFLAYSFCIFSIYGGILAWLTAGPVLLQQQYGLSPTGFGWLCVVIGATIAFSSLLNARLLKYFAPARLAIVGTAMTAVGGAVVFALGFLPHANTWTVFLPMMIMLFATSFIFSNAYACAMTPFGKIAGITGAIIGFLQILGGVLTSFFISLLPDHNAIPMGAIIACCGLIAFCLALWGRRVLPEK